MMSLVLFFQEFCCSFHGYGLILSDRSSILFDGSSNGVFQKYKKIIFNLFFHFVLWSLIWFVLYFNIIWNNIRIIVVRINGVRVNHFIYTNPQGLYKVVNASPKSSDFNGIFHCCDDDINVIYVELVKNPFNCI